MKIAKIFSAIIIFIMLTSSCKNEALDEEMSLLYEYLAENNIEVEPTSSGLYYFETGFSTLETANSPLPQKGDTIFIIYKGYLLSDPDVVFAESTYYYPLKYTYKVDNVIKGWEEAVGYMKKGMSAKAIVPSKLAYGDERTALIPPYSTLIFEIRIIDIK